MDEFKEETNFNIGDLVIEQVTTGTGDTISVCGYIIKQETSSVCIMWCKKHMEHINFYKDLEFMSLTLLNRLIKDGQIKYYRAGKKNDP